MKTILPFIFFFIALNSFAQISGKIIDNNDEPLPGVSILVKGTQKGAETDFDGNFTINNVSGDKTLVISSIGYKTKEVKVTAPVNNISVVLYEGNELLQEVEIVSRNNKFSRKKTAYVAKLPLKNIENSQVYSTVTNNLLISQSATTFAQALENAVGVETLWGSTGRGGDGAGYYSLRGFDVQPKLVNGVAGVTNGFVNPENIERVEVIKGPSATLFGNSVGSYGGLINIVTKKPYKGTGGNITVSGGSLGFKKATIDLNVTDYETEKFSLRFNTGYQSQDSWQDAGFNETMFMAPAISYQVNNKLTINVNYELTHTKQTNAVSLFLNRYFPLTFTNISELNYDYNRSFTKDDVVVKNPTQNYRAEVAYKITDNWSSQTIVAGGNAKSEGYYTYLWNFADWTKAKSTPYFTTNAQKINAETTTLNLQQNFTGDFKLGDLRNRLVVGADYLESRTEDNSSPWGRVNAITIKGDLLQGLPLTKGNIDTAIKAAGGKNENKDVNQNIFGAYISDVVNILPELSVMAAVRYDRFDYKGDENTTSDDDEAYTESTFSPKFGVVYQPILNELSIFANYQNGFSYVNPKVVLKDPANPTAGTILLTYELEQANQFEAGVKSILLDKKLELTLSYYNISVDNKMVYNPAKRIFIQDGKIKSQGAELEVNSNPVQGLNIRGGVSYNDTEYTKTPSRPELIGTRPAESGPKLSYSLWSDYKFTEETALSGFGLGAGVKGAGDYDTMASYPVTGGFVLPSYTIFNASAYYDAKKFRISVKANNITDKQYYKGWSTVTPQTPFSWLASLTYKF